MTWILTLLSGWQTKAIAIISVAFAALLALFKYKSAKLDKVEHELKIKDKKDEIKEIQSEQKKVALDDEQETIEELIADVKESRHNDVNSL